MAGSMLFACCTGCETATPSTESESGSEKEEAVMTEQEFTLSQLAGTDSLGRKITPASGRKEKKYVGIYYFLWHGYHTQKIYDTSKILKNTKTASSATPITRCGRSIPRPKNTTLP